MLKPILLVEDNPRDLDLSLRALGRTRLANEVVVARDGEEAWNYLMRRGAFAERPKGNPAVVLLDLKLPKIDGVELLNLIRSEPELENLPVVMLTASREQTDVARSYALGVNAYVVKPIEFVDFLEAIRDLGVFWAVINEPPPGSIRLKA